MASIGSVAKGVAEVGSFAVPGLGEAKMGELAIKGLGFAGKAAASAVISHGVGAGIDHAFGHSSKELEESTDQQPHQPGVAAAG